jgi:DNA (cytosine-5)-methyltransferase 1
VNHERPTHLDLFSGIGGFALAAHWAGFRTVGFCEIEPYAQRVLAKNFDAHVPDALRRGHHWQQETTAPEQGSNGAHDGIPERSSYRPALFSDIRTLDGTQFRGVDLITGGFPCQPFSCAGKRRGKEDDRHLWPEMLRVISEARPAWVLGENVAGIINMELDSVLSDLESLGYATRPFVIPACGIDARHRRNRVWIVAHAGSGRWEQGSTGREREVSTGACNESRQPCQDAESVADTERLGQSRSRKHERSLYAAAAGDWEADWPFSGGKGDGTKWLAEPDVGRVVDGLSLELDFARQITAHEKSNRSEKKPARNLLIWKLLRAVWEHREAATTSPELYVCALQDSVPDVPFRDSQSRWLLGARIEEESGLRDMWRDFYTARLASAQDMQFKLLERARTAKRGKTMGNRVDRLRGLGNAIVPQVAFQILRGIREVMDNTVA